MTEEALFELAAVRAEQERDAGIRSASAALSMPGTIDCVSCGEEIPEGRRSANPSATRCIECQTFLEAEKFHR